MIRFPDKLGTTPDPAALYANSALEDWMDIRTIADLFAAQAEIRPDATAIIHLETGETDESPRTLTYGQLNGAIVQAAGALQALGAGPTDTIGFLMPNLLEQQVLFWGVESFAAAMPMNFLLSAEYLAPLMAAAGARFLLAPGPDIAPDIYTKALEVAERLGDKLDALVLVSATVQPEGRVHIYNDIIRNAPPPQTTTAEPQARAALFHTGGTTGAPKLVQHSHRNQLAAAYAYVSAIQMKPQDVCTNGYPMFHVAGAIALSLGTFLAGGSLVNLSPAGFRNPAIIENHWKIVARYGVTVPSGVATALGAIANIPVGDNDISTIRIAITGGSLTPKAVAQRFEAAAGKPLHEVYGMTESAAVICVEPVGGKRVLGSPGFPAPLMQVCTRQLQPSGAPGPDCSAGETGVLLCKGPTVTEGYLNDIHTADLKTSDGWLITGDLAAIGADGRVTIQGRSKDIIIRSGHNIDPAQIEDAALAHPNIAEAAAVGAPDNYAGEVPVCFVVLKDGISIEEDVLKSFIASRVSERPAAPKRVFCITEIPKTGVGKIYKPELRCMAARQIIWDQVKHLPVSKVEAEFAKSGRLQIALFADGLTSASDLRSDAAQILNGLNADWTIAGGAK